MSTVATGIGSLPGEDVAEAVRVVLGELPDLPHLPELSGRGAVAGMVGRALAVLADLDADLQPAGWRLTGSTGSPGLDQRRARSLRCCGRCATAGSRASRVSKRPRISPPRGARPSRRILPFTKAFIGPRAIGCAATASCGSTFSSVWRILSVRP